MSPPDGRPCAVDHPNPQEHLGTCPHCFNWTFIPQWRKRWGGDPRTVPPLLRSRPRPKPAGTRKPKRARKPLPIPLPCIHLGEPTGETRPCKSCNANLDVPLVGCAVHGRCAESRLVKDPDGTPVQCCRICPDRQAPTSVRGILLTGGIGDLFAVEGMMPAEFRASLEAVYYAAPAAKELRELMRDLPGYPRLRHHITLPTGKATHYHQRSVERKTGKMPPGVEDWSIGAIFGRRLPYAGSSFLAHRLADIGPPPGPYVVVVPHSTWGSWADRNFSDADWRVCLDFLDRHGLTGVVLCRETLPVPSHPRLLDWQGRTTIRESVEVLKAAAGYVGIDSNLSVLAAKLFPPARLSIKGHGGWLTSNLASYYAPHQTFPFVAPKLEAPAWN
jgi:hypothetical protein